ncbi:MAG: radical SAM/SPASM domain-containing protein [Armatimonadota bacterium]
MGLLSKVKHGVEVTRDNPQLVTWLARNKLRAATLPLERHYLHGESRFARSIAFRLTQACNLRCRMCRYVLNGEVLANPKEGLPLESWLRVVDEVAPFGPYICITGGEPMLHPHVAEIIRRIRRRQLRCTVVTNGTLLAGRAASFMDSPPDMIVVSLDGPPEVHNAVRNRERVFERAIEGIRAVQELKRELRLGRPVIAINCSVTAHNYRTIDQMLDIAGELGADALNYQYEWMLTPAMIAEHNRLYGGCHHLRASELGAADPVPADPELVVEMVRRVYRRARHTRNGMFVTFHPDLDETGIRRWFSDPRSWVHRRPAACAWMSADILANGMVEACLGLVCGSVKERSFPEIWNGSTYREFRQRLAEEGSLPICVRCCSYFRRD